MDEVLPKEVYEKIKEPYNVAYRTKELIYYELATEINSTMMVRSISKNKTPAMWSTTGILP